MPGPPYTLTTDTNLINAKGKLPAMNTLEKWSQEGKVELRAAFRHGLELAKYPHPGVAGKAALRADIGEPMVLDESFFDEGYLSAQSHPGFDELASVMFPKTNGPLSEGQRNDVMHLLAHVEAGSEFFVTDNTKDFIKDGRRGLLKRLCGVEIYTAQEVVDLLSQRHGWR